MTADGHFNLSRGYVRGQTSHLTLKMLNFWNFTSYCSLKPLWSGMGEVVPARTSPTLHPPSPPTVHQLSRRTLRVNQTREFKIMHWSTISAEYDGFLSCDLHDGTVMKAWTARENEWYLPYNFLLIMLQQYIAGPLSTISHVITQSFGQDNSLTVGHNKSVIIWHRYIWEITSHDRNLSSTVQKKPLSTR